MFENNKNITFGPIEHKLLPKSPKFIQSVVNNNTLETIIDETEVALKNEGSYQLN